MKALSHEGIPTYDRQDTLSPTSCPICTSGMEPPWGAVECEEDKNNNQDNAAYYGADYGGVHFVVIFSFWRPFERVLLVDMRGGYTMSLFIDSRDGRDKC